MRVIPQPGFFSRAPGDVVHEGLPLREGRVGVSLVWLDVPESCVPDIAIANTLGTINQFLFAGYAPGTLLLESCSLTPGLSALGARIFQIRYEFLFSPNFTRNKTIPGGGVPLPQIANGFNSILHYYALKVVLGIPVGGVVEYLPMSSDGTAGGTPPYRLKDFGFLFVPNQP